MNAGLGVIPSNAEGVVQSAAAGNAVLGPRTPSTIVAQLWDAAAPCTARSQRRWTSVKAMD